MQTQYLRYFVDIVECGSITAVARKYFMSTQGLSRAIGSLEKDVGCCLIERTGNGVSATTFGSALLPYAQTILGQEAMALDELCSLRTEAIGKEHEIIKGYCCTAAFDTRCLYPVVCGEDDLFSNVRLQYVADGLEIVGKVASGISLGNGEECFGIVVVSDIDAEAATSLMNAVESSGLAYRPFLKYYDELLVSSHSSLASKKVVDYKDLVGYQLVVPPSPIERLVERQFGSDVRVIVCGDFQFRANMVLERGAVSVIPGLSVMQKLDEGLVAVPLKNPYEIEIGMVAPLHSFLSGPLSSMYKRLVRCYENVIR